jgi:hypothetical protein
MIKQSIAPSKQREVQERQKQYRTEMTADEASKRAEANRAAKLESLGQRMGTLVNQAVAKYAGEAKAATPTFDADKFKNTNPNMSDADAALVKQAAEGGAVDAKLYGILGLTQDATPDAIKNELTKYTKDQNNTIIAGVQTGLPANVMLKDAGPVLESSLGMSLADLGGLLGKTADELQSMTVDDLQRRIDAVGQENFSEIQRLRETVNDPTSSQAGRQEAQQRLIELGEAGVSATEADYQRINQAVQSADVISVAGQEMTIAEALRDENLSASISAALNDPAAMDKLKTDMPELAKFVENNRLALKDADAKLDKSVKDLAAIQADNAKLTTVEGVPMDDFNAAVIPNYTSGPSNTRFEPTEAHKVLQGKDMADSLKADYAGFLKDLARTDGEVAKEFAGMDYKTLAATGLLDRDPSGALYLSQYLKYTENSKALKDPNVLTDPAAAEAAIRTVFDGDLSLYQDMLDDYNKMSSYGLADASPESKQMADILDISPRDGKVDAPTEVAKRLRDNMPSNWSKTGFNPADSLSRLNTETAAAKSSAGLVANYVKDGSIDQNEITELAKTPNPDELYKLIANDRLPFSGDKQPLKNRLNELNLPAINEVFGTAGDQLLMPIDSYSQGLDARSIEELNQENETNSRVLGKLQELVSTSPPSMQSTLRDVINNFNNRQARVSGAKQAKEQAAAEAAVRAREEEAARRDRWRREQLSTSQFSDRALANTLKAAGKNIVDTATGKKQSVQIGGEVGKVANKVKKFLSDASVKFDLEQIPIADIQEFYANIKPYYYQYINQLNGDGIHPGFMAQDLLKSKLGSMLVSENDEGILEVDTWKLLGALTVTMKYLMERENG